MAACDVELSPSLELSSLSSSQARENNNDRMLSPDLDMDTNNDENFVAEQEE